MKNSHEVDTENGKMKKRKKFDIDFDEDDFDEDDFDDEDDDDEDDDDIDAGKKLFWTATAYDGGQQLAAMLFGKKTF